jgi:hypothetical protein
MPESGRDAGRSQRRTGWSGAGVASSIALWVVDVSGRVESPGSAGVRQHTAEQAGRTARSRQQAGEAGDCWVTDGLQPHACPISQRLMNTRA